jgi:hypothetical protein
LKTLATTLAAAGALLVLGGRPVPDSRPQVPVRVDAVAATRTDEDLIEQYCVRCHSDRRLRGNLSLEDYDPSAPHLQPSTTEKMIIKLRAGMMPPPGATRPAGISRTRPRWTNVPEIESR